MGNVSSRRRPACPTAAAKLSLDAPRLECSQMIDSPGGGRSQGSDKGEGEM